MAMSFIGKAISLTSHSDIRYRGILAGIDPNNSTIQLSTVWSMGTETRRPAAQFIPPSVSPYDYIVFRASEVKDLALDDARHELGAHQARGGVEADPAVVGASQQQSQPAAAQQQQSRPTQRGAGAGRGGAAGGPTKKNGVHSATQSMENVERAMSDLQVAGAAGGRNGAQKGINIPTEEFDFEQSNARFDKSALSPDAADGPSTNDPTSPNPTSPSLPGGGPSEEKEKAYNPSKSFFDTLASGPPPAPAAAAASSFNLGVPGGGRGRGDRRARREEERSRNISTFGEPGGGPGLLGPGQYVGGWGRPRGGRGHGHGHGGMRGGRGRGGGGYRGRGGMGVVA